MEPAWATFALTVIVLLCTGVWYSSRMVAKLSSIGEVQKQHGVIQIEHGENIGKLTKGFFEMRELQGVHASVCDEERKVLKEELSVINKQVFPDSA